MRRSPPLPRVLTPTLTSQQLHRLTLSLAVGEVVAITGEHRGAVVDRLGMLGMVAEEEEVEEQLGVPVLGPIMGLFSPRVKGSADIITRAAAGSRLALPVSGVLSLSSMCVISINHRVCTVRGHTPGRNTTLASTRWILNSMWNIVCGILYFYDRISKIYIYNLTVLDFVFKLARCS